MIKAMVGVESKMMTLRDQVNNESLEEYKAIRNLIYYSKVFIIY